MDLTPPFRFTRSCGWFHFKTFNVDDPGHSRNTVEKNSQIMIGTIEIHLHRNYRIKIL